jgi:hypothetical protein
MHSHAQRNPLSNTQQISVPERTENDWFVWRHLIDLSNCHSYHFPIIDQAIAGLEIVLLHFSCLFVKSRAMSPDERFVIERQLDKLTQLKSDKNNLQVLLLQALFKASVNDTRDALKFFEEIESKSFIFWKCYYYHACYLRTIASRLIPHPKLLAECLNHMENVITSVLNVGEETFLKFYKADYPIYQYMKETKEWKDLLWNSHIFLPSLRSSAESTRVWYHDFFGGKNEDFANNIARTNPSDEEVKRYYQKMGGS